MRKIICLIAVVVCLLSSSCKKDDGYIQFGVDSFQIIPPEGWRIQKTAGPGYDTIVSPVKDGAAASIKFLEGFYYEEGFHHYINHIFLGYQRDSKSVHHLEKSDFNTHSGYEGERIVLVNSRNGSHQKIAMYYIRLDHKSYLNIQCTAPEHSYGDYHLDFENCVKSYKK
ncbi:MAG: hypothetical protein FWG20_02990 [Candidatus Cloacimonetes bacterium]|nr:hypothetical protein [Candidatus Cloacimonadota bacterium]